MNENIDLLSIVLATGSPNGGSVAVLRHANRLEVLGLSRNTLPSFLPVRISSPKRQSLKRSHQTNRSNDSIGKKARQQTETRNKEGAKGVWKVTRQTIIHLSFPFSERETKEEYNRTY
jgi:hypothetical protein